MGEKRQLPFAHAAALTPALYARALTLPVAPAIATEVALAYYVILEATHCGHCYEDHLAVHDARDDESHGYWRYRSHQVEQSGVGARLAV